MNRSDLEALLRLNASVNLERESLRNRIVDDESPQDPTKILQRVANEIDAENRDPLEALGYYRGMRWALDLDDMRWLGIDAPRRGTRQLRREQLEQYRRYCELFELEMTVVRRQKAAGMALAQNWSGVESSLRNDIATWRLRLMLRAAGLMFRFGVPGALDVCDSAVFGMFRLLYLRPAA
jgi:hypothetical protein